ncbi:polo-like kinase 3, partial [Linnemannia exigua]
MSNMRHSANNRHQPYGNPNQRSNRLSIPEFPANPLHPTQGSSSGFSSNSSVNAGFESSANSINNVQPAISFFDLLSESLQVDALLGNDDFYESVISEANRQTQLTYDSTISAVTQQHNMPVQTLTPPAFVMVQREVDCLKLVQGSPNVVVFLGEINTSFEKCIRTEICLLNLLQLCHSRKANRSAITVPEVRCFARQILTGLQFIHSKGVIHRGLTMDNILVDVVDRRVGLKIAGFGSAVMAGICTTPFSMASGGDVNEQQAFKVDVFSFGSIICMILSSKIPRISHVNSRHPLSNVYFEELSASKCAQHFL